MIYPKVNRVDGCAAGQRALPHNGSGTSSSRTVHRSHTDKATIAREPPHGLPRCLASGCYGPPNHTPTAHAAGAERVAWGYVSGDVQISEHPTEADDRAIPGHHEGDLTPTPRQSRRSSTTAHSVRTREPGRARRRQHRARSERSEVDRSEYSRYRSAPCHMNRPSTTGFGQELVNTGPNPVRIRTETSGLARGRPTLAPHRKHHTLQRASPTVNVSCATSTPTMTVTRAESMTPLSTPASGVTHKQRGLHAVCGLQRGQDATDVSFDRALPHTELLRNLGVGIPASEEVEDVPFAGRQDSKRWRAFVAAFVSARG